MEYAKKVKKISIEMEDGTIIERRGNILVALKGQEDIELLSISPTKELMMTTMLITTNIINNAVRGIAERV